MSRTIASKSAVASGWKTIAALPELLSESSMSIFTYAVDIANSRSGAGCLSSRLPRRMSRRPTTGPLGGDLALELGLQPGQGGDPLLHRRGRREQPGDALAHAGREDVERVQLARRAQVLLRDLVHAAGDLLQRRGERARAAGDDRRAAVGRELAVPRQHLHQQERDDVDDERDEDQYEDARVVVVVAVRGAAAEQEAELHDVGGYRREEAGDRHHQHVAVGD